MSPLVTPLSMRSAFRLGRYSMAMTETSWSATTPASWARYGDRNVLSSLINMMGQATGKTSAEPPGFAHSFSRSPPRPGPRIGGELADELGQAVAGDLGDGDVLQHRADIRPQRDPHALQRLGRARVAHVLRPLPADRGQRALDRADHVGHGDLGGGPGQPIAAVGAAPGGDEAAAAQLGQHRL